MNIWCLGGPLVIISTSLMLDAALGGCVACQAFYHTGISAVIDADPLIACYSVHGVVRALGGMSLTWLLFKRSKRFTAWCALYFVLDAVLAALFIGLVSKYVVPQGRSLFEPALKDLWDSVSLWVGSAFTMFAWGIPYTIWSSRCRLTFGRAATAT
jgi:hypothetical protein